ncbi:MAG: YeeE/YedE family protein [Acidobacteria bacterium]|nr:MAG: YeeE/YedE family protein [Acidobacteriota bacterium]REK09240.1 MAG: YeeE/YedE family protein [Acidobacteriota bacterium]
MSSERSQRSRGGLEVAAALAVGALFGFGLALSGMLDPAKVIGFLDLFGDWDPSLAFVMGGALLVSTPGYLWLRRRGGPSLLAGALSWPTRTDVDRPLVLGAVLFGVGWGLVGLCPGPALAGWIFLGLPILVFVLAMVVGSFAWGSLGATR